MKVNFKKKILVTSEFTNSEAGAFFQELGFELYHKYIEGNEYAFIVNNACPDILTIPRFQVDDKIDPRFMGHVRSYLNSDLLQSEPGKKLLTSYFKDAQEFDLTDRYSKDLKDAYSVKIHEYLNLGYFVDKIVAEAYKAKFDIGMLRNYLNTAFSFAFEKIQMGEEGCPVEVCYSHNGEAFAVEISFKVEGFEGRREFNEIFEDLMNNTNYFDVTYFHKRSKLTISNLIYKDPKMKLARAYFFTDVLARSAVMETENLQPDIHLGLGPEEKIPYSVDKKLETEQSRRMIVAKKMALFIKNYRQNEEVAKNLKELSIGDIDSYLSFYPRQNSLKDVDQEIKYLILDLVVNEEREMEKAEQVRKIATSDLDGRVQKIQNALSSKTLDDVEEMFVVKGGKENSDDVLRVKKWTEGPDKLSDNERWEVKKIQINEKIQDEAIRVNSSGRKVVEDDLIRVVSHELNSNEDDAKLLVNNMVEEVITSEMNKSQMEEAFALKLLGPQAVSADHVKEKLESQINRMKKVMDQMKTEIIKLRNEKLLSDFEKQDLNNSDDAENQKLKVALSRSLDALKSKTFMLEKAKSDYEINNKFKDQRITNLEEKVAELKEDVSRGHELSGDAKVESLSVENKMLNARLDLANKKMGIMNENSDNRENDVIGKQEKEIEALKANLSITQAVIERLRSGRSPEEKEAATSNPLMADLQIKETTIQNLQTEKKALDEKCKAQAMELKKVEQKLKFTISQLAAASKKTGGNSAQQKSNEAHGKQLEQTNARLTEASADLADKRKEIIKAKQENTMLLSKVAELEKRLAALDKKVA